MFTKTDKNHLKTAIRAARHSSLDRWNTLHSLHVGSLHDEPFHSFTLIIHTRQGGARRREKGEPD